MGNFLSNFTMGVQSTVPSGEYCELDRLGPINIPAHALSFRQYLITNSINDNKLCVVCGFIDRRLCVARLTGPAHMRWDDDATQETLIQFFTRAIHATSQTVEPPEDEPFTIEPPEQQL